MQQIAFERINLHVSTRQKGIDLTLCDSADPLTPKIGPRGYSDTPENEKDHSENDLEYPPFSEGRAELYGGIA